MRRGSPAGRGQVLAKGGEEGVVLMLRLSIVVRRSLALPSVCPSLSFCLSALVRPAARHSGWPLPTGCRAQARQYETGWSPVTRHRFCHMVTVHAPLSELTSMSTHSPPQPLQ